MSKQSFGRLAGTDGKAILGTDSSTPLNDLEKEALKYLDMDKINDLAESLFVLNNRKYGPIP